MLFFERHSRNGHVNLYTSLVRVRGVWELFVKFVLFLTMRFFICVCMCVCVYVCVRARARVCVCVCVCVRELSSASSK